MWRRLSACRLWRHGQSTTDSSRAGFAWLVAAGARRQGDRFGQRPRPAGERQGRFTHQHLAIDRVGSDESRRRIPVRRSKRRRCPAPGPEGLTLLPSGPCHAELPIPACRAAPSENCGSPSRPMRMRSSRADRNCGQGNSASPPQGSPSLSTASSLAATPASDAAGVSDNAPSRSIACSPASLSARNAAA